MVQWPKAVWDTPLEWLEQVIEQRIAEYKTVIQELENVECSLCDELTKKGLYGPRFVRGMGLHHYRSAMEYLEREKDALIEACRANQKSNSQPSSAMAQVAE